MRKPLARLYEEYSQERAFAPLAATTRLVPGVGCEYYPMVMFVGEAPGGGEEARGIPFVGQSGQLLRTMCHQAGIDLDSCFITNVVKYRPLYNRTPYDREIDASRRYLYREESIVKPDIIVPLGRVALSVWVQTMGISRAQAHLTYRHRTDVASGKPRAVIVSAPIFPLLHPSAVLRGLKRRDAYLQDFRVLKEIIR